MSKVGVSFLDEASGRADYTSLLFKFTASSVSATWDEAEIINSPKKAIWQK